jgi:hypothetical protein
MPPHQFDNVSDADLNKAVETVASVKLLRQELYGALSAPREFFEIDRKLHHASRPTVERKLKFFCQSSMMQALVLQHELRLKLLACLDGYLSAVEAGNPTTIYLSARYLLELIATVGFLDDELRNALRTDLRDWQGRALQFLTTLCRGRYASSDPKIVTLMKGFGASGRAVDPINIKIAVHELSKREAFANAVSDYDFLSNICHHNGSAHALFQRSMRVTNQIKLATGDVVLVPKGASAITLVYPLERARRLSIVQTAKLVLACCAWGDTILRDLPLVPFTNEQVASLTKGQLHDPLQYTKPTNQNARERYIAAHTVRVGRNDPCPCGSKKKYKHCCLRYAS